jgi:hypothetical protein
MPVSKKKVLGKDTFNLLHLILMLGSNLEVCSCRKIHVQYYQYIPTKTVAPPIIATAAMDAAAGSLPSHTSWRPLRIVLCPWLAFGYILPYLELAERLASRGHRVSFVSTPRNLVRLPPRRHAIDLVALPLPRVEGLPDGAECTNDVPGDKLGPLFDAFDVLAAPFAEYLAAACAAAGGERPDWVLADTLSHWASAVAYEHGVPCAMLQPTAAVIAALGCGASERAELAAASVFEQLVAVERRDVAMPRFEWEKIAALCAPFGASGMSILRRAALNLERCKIAAIRSCPDSRSGSPTRSRWRRISSASH